VWKRFFLIVPGTYFVIHGLLTPLYPARNAEAVGFNMATIGFMVLGAWMIYRGWRLRPISRRDDGDLARHDGE